MSLSFQNAIQSGQAHKKKLAGLFLFSARRQRAAWSLCLFIAAVVFCALCLSGCGETVSDASFAEQLDLIDACILNGQNEDALTLIDKVSDDAIGLVRQLSIAKRYIKLGEMEKTKKFVEGALKKQPEAPELNALYANILLSDGNVLGAMKYTDKLANTKWSPLYTEVVIRRIVAENIFMDGDYTDYFVKAAEATHNERWLVDAAVVEARRGNYKKAASLTPPLELFYPGTTENERFAYFWALVNYDAGYYLECVDLCKLCGSIPDAALLASDAWLMSGEEEAANNYWLAIVNGASSNSASGGSANARKSIPKEIYCNAAMYAINHNDLTNAYSILVDMVSKYPDFDEGLVVYAKYALKTSGSMITEPYSVLSTLQQQKMREIPSIPVSDALARIEKSLALDIEQTPGTPVSEKFRPALYVEYLRTKWLSGNSTPIQSRKDILLALERFRLENECEPYLADFAVCWMLRNYYENEAESFFYDYMAEKYGLGAADFADNASMLKDRECMIAAWFRLKNGFIEDAQKLYETYVYERGCIGDTVATMNLAAIYNTYVSWQKALELYGTLAGTTKNLELASEVHYRMGTIQLAHKDEKNALLSLSYSIKLNPDNNRARHLLKTLQ
ncbi:MAG: hypothetical protein J5647_03135 [Spirochaetaceae bacterium]|nr:hypothetical protein [Spirochaetaceae bacterium]